MAREPSPDGTQYSEVPTTKRVIYAAIAATPLTEGMKAGALKLTVPPHRRADPEHVARAVVYMAGLPLDVNVQFITVMATKMPCIGRG